MSLITATKPLYFDRGNPLGEVPLAIATAAINTRHSQYVDPLGAMPLRTTIANTLFNDISVSYDAKTEIIVTTGAAPAIYCIIKALASGNEQILLPNLGWPAYYQMAKTLGKNIGYYPLPIEMQKTSAAMWYFKMKKCITQQTRLLVLNFPHNPTGNMLNKEWLFYLVKLAESYPKMVFLSDETYCQITFDDNNFISPASLSPLTKRVVIVRSFSKAYGMAGWRLGYIAAPQKIAKLIYPCHVAIHNYASSISQTAGQYILNKGDTYLKQMRLLYKKNRDALMQGLNNLKLFGYHKPQGTFYLFPKITKFGLSADKLSRLLTLQENIFIYPGTRFGKPGKDYIRICFAVSNQHLKQLISRLTNFIEKYHV